MDYSTRLLQKRLEVARREFEYFVENVLTARKIVSVDDSNQQFGKVGNSYSLEVAGHQCNEQPVKPKYLSEDVPEGATGISIAQQIFDQTKSQPQQILLSYALGASSQVVLLDDFVECS